MRIEKLKISDINPAPYNPRLDLQPGDPEYQKLKKSIEEFELVEPLVYNERTGNLVGGHQRLKILKERGDIEVEVSVVDMDEVKEKALNLALNKISGDWDYPRLKDLLEELDIGDFDMEITGFDLKEIEDLMTQFHVPEEGLTDDDEIPEQVETICKKGDLWELGNHRLLCGDATCKEDVERLMGGEKAVLMATDPPYAVDYVEKARDMNRLGYGHSRATLSSAISGDGIEEGQQEGLWRDTFTNAIAVAITDNAAWYVWHDCRRAMLLICNLLTELGLLYHQGLIWVKNNFVIGRCDYQANTEGCFYGWMKGNRPPFYGEKNQTTAWKIDRDANNKPIHPTQKPVELSVIPLTNHTKVNEICYDPFGGSGSTLIACEKLGRRCFMMEISEMYSSIIIQRWQNYTGKQAIKIDNNTTS